MIPTLNQELIARLSVFVAVLLIMLAWEQLSPRRPRSAMTWLRRINNLMLVLLNTLLLRLLIPIAAVAMSAIAQLHGWGLFNVFSINPWVAGVISFLLLDLIIYFQHRLFHRYQLLWRLHRVHHCDTEFDVTTGLRFHPLEIMLSMCIKLAAVVLTGAPPVAVLVFEILLNATSLFNHGNVVIAPTIDRYLRWGLVTPDMHRVHHSAQFEETNSNFGFNIPWWDRIFRTYRDQPELGHENVIIGLKEFRDRRFVNVLWLLKQPVLDSAEFADNQVNIKQDEENRYE